jgi:hypothetical protein
LRDRVWPDQLRFGEHIIQIYSTDEEKLRTIFDLINWMGDDLVVLYFSDNFALDALKDSQKRMRRGIEAAIDSGKLRTFPGSGSFCTDGRLLLEEWRSKWQNLLSELEKEGVKYLMKVSDFSWVADVEVAPTELFALEAHKLLTDLPKNTSIICQYDRRLFTKDMIRRFLALHETRLEWETLKRNFWLIQRKPD